MSPTLTSVSGPTGRPPLWGDWCPPLGLHLLLALCPWLALHVVTLSNMAIWLKTLLMGLLLLNCCCCWGQICMPRCMPLAYFLPHLTESSICWPWAGTAWPQDSPIRLPLSDSWWAGEHSCCWAAWRWWHDWWLELEGVNDHYSPIAYAGDPSLLCPHAQQTWAFLRKCIPCWQLSHTINPSPQEEVCSHHLFGLLNQPSSLPCLPLGSWC